VSDGEAALEADIIAKVVIFGGRGEKGRRT